ncbi:MAG: hypothetical protein ACFFDI_21050 [Promethearchaeota archaeon]
MDFDIPVRTTYKDISSDDYFDGVCPFCDPTRLDIRTSRIREVCDLRSTSEKVVARLDVVTFHCQQCERLFTPEHPFYPPKWQSTYFPNWIKIQNPSSLLSLKDFSQGLSETDLSVLSLAQERKAFSLDQRGYLDKLLILRSINFRNVTTP